MKWPNMRTWTVDLGRGAFFLRTSMGGWNRGYVRSGIRPWQIMLFFSPIMLLSTAPNSAYYAC